MDHPHKRQSNIELLRIVGMLLIISHHYIVNSGIMESISLQDHPAKFTFLTLWGMWGKTGINIFILISGYYMCTSSLTIRRYCKIAFEWIFYHYVIYFIMLATGYETVSPSRILQLIFSPFIYANGNGCFSSSFLMFYLFIQFLNTFIRSITGGGQYRRFILLLLFLFTGLSTFFMNNAIFGEVFWFIAVYFIGGYLRLYPPKWSTNLRQSSRLLLLSVAFCYLSVILFAFLQASFQFNVPLTFFVTDANKLGAILVGVFLFSTFCNLNIAYSGKINLIAKTTFGILMIHANSDAWRTFMWRDLLHVDVSASLPALPLIGRSIVIVGGIFICCSLIDMGRIFLIERPVFNHFDRIEEVILKVWGKIKGILMGVYRIVLYWAE
ncbi:acyltransferase family protein [Bacillota bacterium LCP21S3_A4]